MLVPSLRQSYLGFDPDSNKKASDPEVAPPALH